VDKLIGKLRQVGVVLALRKTVEEACRGLEITGQTYYRWCLDYTHRRPHIVCGYQTQLPIELQRSCSEWCKRG